MQLKCNEKISPHFFGTQHWPSLSHWPWWSGSTALYDGLPLTWCHFSLNNEVSMSESEISSPPHSDYSSVGSETPVRDEERSSVTLQKRSEMAQTPGKSPDLVTSTEQRQTSVTAPPASAPAVPPHAVTINVPDCIQVLTQAFTRPPSPLSESFIGAHLVSMSGLQMRNKAYNDHAERVKYSVGLPTQPRLVETPVTGPPWSGSRPGDRPPTIGGNPRHTPVSGPSTPTTCALPWPPGPTTLRPPPASSYSTPTFGEGGAIKLNIFASFK